LASASEYGVFSGNMTILSPLIESALQKMTCFHHHYQLIRDNPTRYKKSKSQKYLHTASSRLNDTDKRIFSKPIIQRTVDINDFEIADNIMPPSLVGSSLKYPMKLCDK